jgi:AcrR family transcriptional regulator
MAEELKKEDRRVRRTKKLLTQALTKLLEKKQVNEITVKELTDLADMNRGTFYLYYKDIYDMLEKIEDEMFQKLDVIAQTHEHGDITQEVKPLLLDLFRFIGENQEMCRVLLSPNGDINFLHRLYEAIRERIREIWADQVEAVSEKEFDYRYSFVVFGCAGMIRAWVNRNCQETDLQMAELADAMIRRGTMASAGPRA